VSIIKKILYASLGGTIISLAFAASAFAVVQPIIYFDYCGTYGWVEYTQTVRGPKVERGYMSIETGEGLGYKVWRNGELVKDTLGQTCQNDL